MTCFRVFTVFVKWNVDFAFGNGYGVGVIFYSNCVSMCMFVYICLYYYLYIYLFVFVHRCICTHSCVYMYVSVS